MEGGINSAARSMPMTGVEGSGSKLPHYDKIQASFGKHDVSHIQATTGTQATSAAKAVSAQAYTSGNKIAFGDSSPSLHTSAYEATHVVQQGSVNTGKLDLL